MSHRPTPVTTGLTAFSPTVRDFWRGPFTGEVLRVDARLTLVVNQNLHEDERVVVLWTAEDERTSIALTPDVAEAAGLRGGASAGRTEAGVRAALSNAGLVLHGADNIFHLLEPAKAELLAEPDAPGVRRLTAADADVFAAFEAGASEQDLDEAYVELDHWAVFGAFDGGRLVSAASMYPWRNSKLADLGVLTLEPDRGHGHGIRVVRALYRYALAQGYEPQYRCQLDNAASAALAKASGLELFGRWETVLSR